MILFEGMQNERLAARRNLLRSALT
jgi:hypothetical protein